MIDNLIGGAAIKIGEVIPVESIAPFFIQGGAICNAFGAAWEFTAMAVAELPVVGMIGFLFSVFA